MEEKLARQRENHASAKEVQHKTASLVYGLSGAHIVFQSVEDEDRRLDQDQ